MEPDLFPSLPWNQQNLAITSLIYVFYSPVLGDRDFITMIERSCVSNCGRSCFWKIFWDLWDKKKQKARHFICLRELILVKIISSHQNLKQNCQSWRERGQQTWYFLRYKWWSLAAPAKVSWAELFRIMTEDCSCCRECKMKGQCD